MNVKNFYLDISGWWLVKTPATVGRGWLIDINHEYIVVA
jgi:hypothetical protein